LDLLIEQVVDYAIYVLDRAGHVASWNAGAKRIKGYEQAEILGKPYAVFFSEEDRQRGRPEAILAAARANGRYQEEGWRIRKDGSRFWASAVVTALRGPDGELRGFAKITRDLTERQQAEEEARRAAAERAAREQSDRDAAELRRSRDQLNLILRSINEGVTAQDTRGRLVFANDAAAQLCGLPSGQAMIECPPDQILSRFEVFREDGSPFPPADLPGRKALLGTASSAIVRFRARPTGEERWSFVSSAPVFDAKGNVDLAVTVFREFTERRRAEAAWRFLAEASAVLGSSLDYASTLRQVAALAVPAIADWCTVEIVSAQGVLEQLAMAHADPEKVALAKEWRRRWPPGREATAYQVLRDGEPMLLPFVTEETIDAVASEPEHRRMARQFGLRSAMVVPLIVGQRPFGVVSFLTAESGRTYNGQDLILATEVARRASLAVENARAYTEAKLAVQTRDNFLAIASHELRTPLSALTVLTSSLVRAAAHGRLMSLGPDGLRDRMERAERQTRQLARLVDRLLDVSRLSSRDLRLDREETNLGDIVREAVSRYEDAAAEVGSQIKVTAVGDLTGYWDKARLDQVVSNLVGNAVKYGAGAPIEVIVGASRSGHVRLVIKDGGPGIASEDQERIFDQYERASPSDNIPGMGLGLWIVRRIVAAHGGAVTLDSARGRGSVFTVILPSGRKSPDDTPNPLPAEDRPGSSRGV
jgi:PAS domain S-box-containing protein